MPTLYKAIIPRPVRAAIAMAAPSLKFPVSKEGAVKDPAAAAEVEAAEDEELPLPEEEPPVAVATLVTVPVPEVPAWERRVEQVEAVEAVWTEARELKSQAVAFLPCST